MIELLNMDCMDYLAGLKDNAFELCICDPPYGIKAGTMTMGRGSGNDTGRHTKKHWDENPPTKDYFKELQRVSDNQIIWGGNYFPLPPSRCWLLWDKIDYNSDFASHEMAWTSFDKVVKCFKRARSVDNDNKGKIHPVQKPVKLYEWLLKNYAKEGDRILDTHLGSASSAIAAHNYGFDFVGMELDKDYYDAAVKRFEQHKAQLKIF